jgi:hypothetical protein
MPLFNVGSPAASNASVAETLPILPESTPAVDAFTVLNDQPPPAAMVAGGASQQKLPDRTAAAAALPVRPTEDLKERIKRGKTYPLYFQLQYFMKTAGSCT